MSAPLTAPPADRRTGDAAVDAALAELTGATAPGADPLESARALATAHDALRARLADAG
ncbi:hypothetical protein [Quadrisphaera sp. INWT6]|uniref:hypothetical protein n=1 Tax=Quadrisphaera sp. INWT6 TaxID=2596917 RepID=UPI00189264E9|nr:hypothetical protein [Quadrisphaera sp. INWT6]